MQRLVLLVVLVLGVVAIGAMVDLLLLEPHRTGAERIASLQLQLDEVAARIDDAKRRLAEPAAAEPIDIAQLAIASGDGAAALASLQERVRNSVAAHGGQALSTVGAIAGPVDGVSRLTVGLSGRFEEAQLFAFLSELESGTPPLVVDAVTVRPLPVPGGLPLDVNVTLLSFAVGTDAS
jgi:hypothetical protein